MTIRLIIAYLLNLFDLAASTYWVNRFGIGIEANPIGRWLFTNNIAWAVKIFAVGGLLAVLHFCIRKRPKLAWVAYIPLVVYALLAVYHVVLTIFINL